jgi:hypothetical protein
VNRRHRWKTVGRDALLIAAITMGVAAMVGEIGVRLIGRVDEDGNLFFMGYRVPPYHLPVAGTTRAVDTFLSSRTATVVEDPDLGWVPRAGSHNELFTFNDIGLRVGSSGRTYSPDRRNGVLRIEVFGDSFTLGDEVSEPDSWATRIERELTAAGRPAEVMNFGVNGYGIDQAFLRWRARGIRYSPDVVILGLQVENVRRNVNLIRPLYNPFIDLPFSKPRFIRDGNELRLINVPPVPATELAEHVRNINRWPLTQHEAYYDPAKFRLRPWQRSRLLALVMDLASRAPENREAGEQYDLTLDIMAAFEKSVETSGARFMVLHLPRRADLDARRNARSTPDTRFVQEVARRFSFIDPADRLVQLLEDRGSEELFRPRGHYSAMGNAVLASQVLRELERKPTSRPRQ